MSFPHGMRDNIRKGPETWVVVVMQRIKRAFSLKPQTDPNVATQKNRPEDN